MGRVWSWERKCHRPCGEDDLEACIWDFFYVDIVRGDRIWGIQVRVIGTFNVRLSSGEFVPKLARDICVVLDPVYVEYCDIAMLSTATERI